MTTPLQLQTADWHRKRFPDAKVEHVALKACEEVGELASTVLGQVGMKSATGSGDPLGEAADVVICLLVMADRWLDGDLLEAVKQKLAVLNDPSSGHRASLSKQ